MLNAAAPLSLGDVAEDNAQPGGSAIAALLAAAGDPISDADDSPQEGLALIAADATHGAWQFSLAGPPAADWQPVGVVSPTLALLLPDTAWLRFVPAADYVGPSGELTFRAWDQTSGAAGQRVDATQTGGSSAFSVATGTVVANVTAVNDPPVLSGLPTALTYTEDATPLRIMNGALVVDVDSAMLAGATVRLTNAADGDAESLAATAVAGISAVYEEGALQLSGVASLAAYQQVLRTVAYRNTSQDPDAADRLIEITVSDASSASAPRTVTVRVQPVNDPPALDLDSSSAGNDGTAVFYINRAPVALAPNLILTDQDNTTLKEVTVRITNLKNAQAELLSVDTGVAANIKSSYDAPSGLLTLSGTDSIANYQQVLRTVTYDNALPQPNREDRRIEFRVSDGAAAGAPRVAVVQLLPAPTEHLLMPLVSRRGEEPNDTCAESFALIPNRSEQFLPDDVFDWFTFDLATPADVVVELHDFSPRRGQVNVATGVACQQLRLIKSNGDPTTDKIIDLGRQPAGRYYIRLIADGPLSDSAAYTLLVRAVTP